MCIDNDIGINSFIDYETSFEQVFTYEYRCLSNLEKTIWCFTMVIRFARSSLPLLSKEGCIYQESVKHINHIKSMSPQEITALPPELLEDLEEVESYFKWLEEKQK